MPLSQQPVPKQKGHYMAAPTTLLDESFIKTYNIYIYTAMGLTY
jgi:hypothetical protein